MIKMFIRKYKFSSLGLNIEHIPHGYVIIIQIGKRTNFICIGTWGDVVELSIASQLGGKKI